MWTMNDSSVIFVADLKFSLQKSLHIAHSNCCKKWTLKSRVICYFSSTSVLSPWMLSLVKSCSWLCLHGMISCTCRALPDLTLFNFLLCTQDSSRSRISAPPIIVKFLSVRGAKLLLRHNNNKICQEEEEEERKTVEVNSIYTRWGGRTH